MTQENMDKVDDVVDKYFQHFGRRDDVTIFNMPFDSEVVDKFIILVEDSIARDKRISNDNLITQLKLDVPEDAVV